MKLTLTELRATLYALSETLAYPDEPHLRPAWRRAKKKIEAEIRAESKGGGGK